MEDHFSEYLICMNFISLKGILQNVISCQVVTTSIISYYLSILLKRKEKKIN